MPFNFRLNLQSVFRRLGIQSGARLPQLEDNVTMVMLVTDLSRLIPAPIEPRGFAGVNILPPAGQASLCQLRALAPGGVFIESVFLRGSAPPDTADYVINVDLVDLGLPVGQQIDVGGTLILSRFTAGSQVAGVPGVTLPSPDGFSAAQVDVGIFVPNQAFFTLAQNTANQRLDVAILYRELPSVEEVG